MLQALLLSFIVAIMVEKEDNMFKRLNDVLNLLNSRNHNELADNIEINAPEPNAQDIIEQLLKLTWFMTWLDWFKTTDLNSELRDDNGKLYSTGTLNMSETIKLGSDIIEIGIGATVDLEPAMLVGMCVDSNDPVQVVFKSLTINYIKHVNSGIQIAKNFEIDSDFEVEGNVQSITIEYERLLSLYNGINRKNRARNIIDDYTFMLDLDDYSDDIKVAVGLGIITHCVLFESVSYNHNELVFEYDTVPNTYDELKKVHPSIITDAKIKKMATTVFGQSTVERVINHSKLLGKIND